MRHLTTLGAWVVTLLALGAVLTLALAIGWVGAAPADSRQADCIASCLLDNP